MLLAIVSMVATVGFPGEFVAKVNGHVLTETELGLRVTNSLVLVGRRMSRPDLEALFRHEMMYRRGYPRVWVEERLLSDYAASNKIEISEQVMTNFRERAFRNFGKLREKDFNALYKIKGLDRACFDDSIRCEATRKVLRDYWVAECPTNIPSDYVTNTVQWIAEWNRSIPATNALVFAKATNVWEQLKAGADFVATAKRWTELKDELEDDCQWGSVDANFLSDEPELLAALRSMKPGEFTAPIAADGGVLIVRLDENEQDGGFIVSRIFFRLPQLLKPAPDEEIVARFYKKYADALFARRLKALVDAAQIEYFNDETLNFNQENNDNEGEK